MPRLFTISLSLYVLFDRNGRLTKLKWPTRHLSMGKTRVKDGLDCDSDLAAKQQPCSSPLPGYLAILLAAMAYSQIAHRPRLFSIASV